MLQNPVVRNERRVENSDFLGRYRVVVFGSQDEPSMALQRSNLTLPHSPFGFPTSVGGSHFKQSFQNVGKRQWPVWTQLSNKLLVSVPVRKSYFSTGVYFPQQSHKKIPTQLLNLLSMHSLNSACLGSCQQESGPKHPTALDPMITASHDIGTFRSSSGNTQKLYLNVLVQ